MARLRHLDVPGNPDFLHRLPDFHKLRGARLGVGFEFPPFGAVIRVVVVSPIAKQQAGIGSMHDQPDVAIHSNRPESAILRLIELVELQTRLSRVQLEVEGRRLYGFLLIAREFGQAAGKRVCDADSMDGSVHPEYLHHFIAQMINNLYRDPAGYRFVKGAGRVAVQSSPGFLVDFGLKSGLQGFVWFVRA